LDFRDHSCKLSGMDEENSEQLICSVCLETMDNRTVSLVSLSCLHKFHFDCLRECASFDHRCPMCRQETIPEFQSSSSELFPVITFPLTPRLIRALASENIFTTLQSDTSSESGSEDESAIVEREEL